MEILFVFPVVLVAVEIINRFARRDFAFEIVFVQKLRYVVVELILAARQFLHSGSLPATATEIFEIAAQTSIFGKAAMILRLRSLIIIFLILCHFLLLVNYLSRQVPIIP